MTSTFVKIAVYVCLEEIMSLAPSWDEEYHIVASSSIIGETQGFVHRDILGPIIFP